MGKMGERVRVNKLLRFGGTLAARSASWQRRDAPGERVGSPA